MSPAGIFDESDLLSMAPPELQRALLKAPDDLLAQALAGAPAPVAERIAANLSRRRASAVRTLSRRLTASGELGPAAAKTALRNLVRRVFEISAPEADGPEASRSVAREPAVATGETAAPRPQPGPDLAPGAFAALREVRAVFDAARKISPFVQGLERGKLGANAAALIRAYLRG